VAAFYKFFERPERMEDWLAKLYGVALASGLEFKTGDYRLSESRQRIDRYQISLPVTGTYTQIRSFLENVLTEIPVLSLDQASFRRKATNEGRIDAEIVLTLHLLRK
jgi:Tfp pilus assembly protein PilO